VNVCFILKIAERLHQSNHRCANFVKQSCIMSN